MIMKPTIAFAASAVVALGFGLPAAGQISQDPGVGQTIIVPKDKSAAFRLDYPASEIVVAQPDTLSLVATTDRSFYVRGKKLGVTNILIYDDRHRLAQVVDVRVGYDVATLQSDLAAALPGEHIDAANFADGILLTGEVSNPSVAARAEAIAERYAPKAVESELTLRAAQQVEVDVRVLEVAHTAIKDLGFNFNVQGPSGFLFSTGSFLGGGAPSLAGGSTTGNPFTGSTTLLSGNSPQGTIGVNHRFGLWNLDANIEALEQKSMIRELARPNLVAMSGQEASFLAGGQFPYPIPNGQLGVTIAFQEFGVKLKVTPTVMDNGQIQLKIAPEVSELSPTQGINVQGFQVPAITERRANTQIELSDGQSFAIAGLFQRDYSNVINQIPGVSKLPVLGTLFRSADWQRSETELVIIVTPHLIAPVNDIAQLPNPLKETAEATAIDVILDGKNGAEGRPNNPDGDLVPAASVTAPPSSGSSAASTEAKP
jgi:pilus assembly protein CpaC